MRSTCALLVALFLIAGCGRQPSVEQAAESVPQAKSAQVITPIPGEVVGDFVIGEPLRYGQLTVFPISSLEPKTTDRFLSLDEGLAAGLIEISELGAAHETAAENYPVFGGQQEESQAEETSPEDAPDTEPAGDEETPASEDPVPDSTSEDPFEAETDETTEDGAQQTTLIQMERDDAVNRLAFVNHSDRPLYLMPGELIIGGKQDRTIARETIVPANGKVSEVEVFCVEQGRWSTRTQEELREAVVAAAGGETDGIAFAVSVSPDLQASELETELESTSPSSSKNLISQKKFVASLGAVSSNARRAVQESQDQSSVWNQVQVENKRSGSETETSAFTANYLNPDVLAELAPYMQELGEPVSSQPQVVGVLVAIDNQIKTIDVFESTPLFQKMWPKLLKSFAFDALDAAELAAEDAKIETVVKEESPPLTLADAKHHVELAIRSGVEEIETLDGLTMTRRKADEMVSFSVHDEESLQSSGGGMGGGGGFFGSVHGGGFY